ncbi:COX15/CtaA family protein [Fontisphaera persica]|uniref:COX15/CtaA family protein n=1 Tax=Fontisphaera persica TaxID=2974023 RepID=UPI0024C0B9EF|nr:COX15/CtaA family protein [Fontisphaera persica]WCJ58668.1 COX15/CtaA family protein [Fontisphaera persica]
MVDAPLAPVRTTGLNRFAWVTALATLGLIGMGGLVTSHGVGMAVPDWPTTYGYNMFLFPVSQWVGGIFYEHTHRLWASGVGLLTTILAVWMWVHRTEILSRKWLRVLGVVAFVGVSVQGVLGGLRVTLIKDELGIVHGTLAQLFLVLMFAIALYTSRWWPRIVQVRESQPWEAHRWWLTGLAALTLLQLVLGATMRHQHAGLAVPDFPLAYGRIWPPTDAQFLETVNQTRLDARDFKPITAAHVYLHMAHRGVAVMLLVGVAALAWHLRKRVGSKHVLTVWAYGWFVLVVVQGLLGAGTVWSNKAADIATLHVVLGAVLLVYGSLLSLVAWRLTRATQPLGAPATSNKSVTLAMA